MTLRAWAQVAAAALVLPWALAGCGGGASEEPTAQGLCDDLADTTLPIQQRALINDADDEVRDALFDTCPDVIGDVLGIADLATEIALQADIDLDDLHCGRDDITGTVTNHSDQTVSVTLEVELTLDGGRQVATRTTSVRRLSPGQDAEWDVPVFNDEDYDRCSVDIRQVTPE